MLPVSDYPKNKKYATGQDYYKMTTKRHYSFDMEVLTTFFFSEYGTGAVLHVTFLGERKAGGSMAQSNGRVWVVVVGYCALHSN